MLYLTKSITSVLTAGTLMLGTIVPSAFADVQISGNGAFSSNSVSTSSNNSIDASQSNNANFTNTVTSNNNTGGNSSSFNTGGSSSVNTGSANSSVNIQNRANSNSLNLGLCGCMMPSNNQDVNISGNGFGSHNHVSSNTSNTTDVSQNNNSFVSNDVSSHNNTGHNTSFGNTGGTFWMNNPWWWNNNNFGGNNGFSQSTTGNASSHITISNAANSNTLN